MIAHNIIILGSVQQPSITNPGHIGDDGNEVEAPIDDDEEEVVDDVEEEEEEIIDDEEEMEIPSPEVGASADHFVLQGKPVISSPPQMVNTI